MSRSITAKAFKGGLFSIFMRFGNIGINIIVLSLLARLLSPLEYGVFGIITLIVGLISIVPASIGQSIVQIAQDDPAAVGAGNVLTLAASFLCCLMALCLAAILIPLIGLDAYHGAYFWMMVSLPLISMTVYLDSVLGHRHQFYRASVADFAGQVSGSYLATLILASLGQGVMALIWGNIIYYGVKLIGQLAGNASIVTKLRRPNSNIVKSSAWFTVIQLANYLGRSGDNLVVSHALGLPALGIYGRAYNLMAKPVLAVSGFVGSIFYPLLASVRSEPARFRRGYERATLFCALLGLSLGGYFIMHSKLIVLVVLGNKWDTAVAPFAVLAAATYFRLAYRVTETVAFAAGKVRSAASRQLIYALLVVVGALFGSHWGLVGIATAVCIALAAFFALSVSFANKLAGLATYDWLKLHIPSAIAVLLAAACSRLLLSHTHLSELLSLVLSTMLYWSIFTMIILMHSFINSKSETSLFVHSLILQVFKFDIAQRLAPNARKAC